jgi:energy-coupling factor transporter transmembrane protein EcfT
MRLVLDLWGSGTGPVRRLAPAARGYSALLVGAAVLALPVERAAGAFALPLLVGAWLSACRPPARAAQRAAGLAVAVFLPVYGLTALLPAGDGVGAEPVARGLALRGAAALLVGLGGVSTLALQDLGAALRALPIPPGAAAIATQIVHQSGTLLEETARISDAMAVRGAAGSGLAGLRVLRSLPAVWLPRVLDRAERVGAAMELRGLCDIPASRSSPLGPRDAAWIVATAATLGLALALRLRSPG